MAIKPQVLLGHTRSPEFLSRIEAEKFGIMFTERAPVMYYEGMPWAVDNGCYSAWRNDTPWDALAWAKRIDRWRGAGTPLFAVVPDTPTKGNASLEFSRDYCELVPIGWPKALAVQDGMTFQAVKRQLSMYDWIFIGGSNAFKVTARDWVRFAREEGKKVHYARASTLEKLEWAKHLEVDSLDSSFPVVDEGAVQAVRGYLCPRTSQLCPVPQSVKSDN